MSRISALPWRWIVAGLVLGVGGALFLSLREPGESLTHEGLDAARALWQSRGPAGYEMEVETGGAVGSRQVVVVSDGEVISMTSGGVEAAHAAWRFWSVEGLFGFLETELANAEQPHQAYGVGAGEVVVRVRFHPELGYPEYFLRHVMGKKLSIEWRILSFTPTAPGGGSPRRNSLFSR